jgi:hypothetical protein
MPYEIHPNYKKFTNTLKGIKINKLSNNATARVFDLGDYFLCLKYSRYAFLRKEILLTKRSLEFKKIYSKSSNEFSRSGRQDPISDKYGDYSVSNFWSIFYSNNHRRKTRSFKSCPTGFPIEQWSAWCKNWGSEDLALAAYHLNKIKKEMTNEKEGIENDRNGSKKCSNRKSERKKLRKLFLEIKSLCNKKGD